MSIQIRLGDYPITPLYNIKAVVQATNISSSTLRAWERRYAMCRPQRSESGYRLYSDRDVAKIRWLKGQVDTGMSISQAVSWLEQMIEAADSEEDALLPDVAERIRAPSPRSIEPQQVRSYSALQSELLERLLLFDEDGAEQVISEAFAMYSVEDVGEYLFVPTMIEIGERWHSGRVSITVEHFISNYLMQRLMSLMRVTPNTPTVNPIWVSCAPGESHELGAILLSIFVRRAGYPVHYLGRDLPTDDLLQEVKRQRPAMLLFSASTYASAVELESVTDTITRISPPRPIIGYGGRAFEQHAALREKMAGIYLGASAQDAVSLILDLIGNGNVKSGYQSAEQVSRSAR